MLLNRTKQDSLKNFFFQNEYVGGFARVIADKEIIFLNLRFPVLNQDLKNLLYKISILLWCEQKEIFFQEIFLPSWGLMSGEVSYIT